MTKAALVEGNLGYSVTTRSLVTATVLNTYSQCPWPTESNLFQVWPEVEAHSSQGRWREPIHQHGMGQGGMQRGGKEC